MQVENLFFWWNFIDKKIDIKKSPNFCIEKNFDYNCSGKYYF